MKRLVNIVVISLFFLLAAAGLSFSEELTFVTINAWPAIASGGIISSKEYETENDRMFRNEILVSGLRELNADIIVLNGVNPAKTLTESVASGLGMNFHTWVSESGVRFGPVGLPLNLQTGDSILSSPELQTEPAGRLFMNGLLSTAAVTLFSKNGVQVIGSRVTLSGTDFYLFSVVWTESPFDDEKNLSAMMNAYLDGELSAEQYVQLIDSAVTGREKRSRQAAESLSFINSISGESPVVIMGSLNALPGGPELALLKDGGFTDVFASVGRGAGYTVDTAGNGNFSRIPKDDEAALLNRITGSYRADYILVRGDGLKPLSAGIVLNKPVYGVFPSIRYGVKAVIDIKTD